MEKAQRWIKTEKNKRGQWKIKSKTNKKFQGYYNSWHQSQFFHMRSTQQWNRKRTSLSAHFGCHHFIVNDHFAHDLRLFSNLPRFAKTEIIIKKTQAKHESQVWSIADLFNAQTTKYEKCLKYLDESGGMLEGVFKFLGVLCQSAWLVVKLLYTGVSQQHHLTKKNICYNLQTGS